MEKSKIREFRKKLRKFDRLNELFNNTCCIGVTMAQCHALLEIEELGEATANQLAKNLLLDKSTLSRTVDSLVRLGFVERKENSIDRRYVTLVLSKEGIKKCNEINQKNDETYNKMLSQLSKYEADSLLMNFDLFVKVLDNHMHGKNDQNSCCG